MNVQKLGAYFLLIPAQ